MKPLSRDEIRSSLESDGFWIDARRRTVHIGPWEEA